MCVHNGSPWKVYFLLWAMDKNDVWEALVWKRPGISVFLLCWGDSGCRGGCRCVCKRAPWGHPAPPLGLSGCPSLPLRTAAGRLVGTYPALVGPVRFKPAAPTLTQTPSPLPFPQGYGHSCSCKTPWSPLLAGGCHGSSRSAPAGHSGLCWSWGAQSSRAFLEVGDPGAWTSLGESYAVVAQVIPLQGTLTEEGRHQEWD